MPSLAGQWLVALADPGADPGGLGGALPGRALAPAGWRRVLALAEAHGVLPAVVANARALASRDGAAALVRAAAPDAALADALAAPAERVTRQVGFTLMLRMQYPPLAAALRARGVPALLLKGADFADRLYPQPAWRPFRDLDVLVPRVALPETQAVMAALGYVPHDRAARKHAEEYGQHAWLPGAGAGAGAVARRGAAVEVHWDLVNSPAVRRALSVQFADLQFDARPDPVTGLPRPSPAAMLLVAAVHGATSHGFDRMMLLCDIRQLVRGAAGRIDHAWLAGAAARTGAAGALSAALDLTARVLDDPACTALRKELALAASPVVPVLLSPGSLLDGPARMGALRRRLYREVLKRG